LENQIYQILSAACNILVAILRALHGYGIWTVTPPAKEGSARLSGPNICVVIDGLVGVDFVPLAIEGNAVLKRWARTGS
jgi:hypothetical protein